MAGLLFGATEGMVRVSLGGRAFDFRNGDHRQKFHEQQVHHEKRTEGANIQSSIPAGRHILAPVRGQKILVQRANHDDEAFAPHADIDQHTDDEQQHQIRAYFLEPQQLGHADVDADQNPAHDHVSMAEETMAEHPTLIGITAVPGDEKFHHVDVVNDETADQGQFGNRGDVALGDDVFESTTFTQRDDEDQHHAEAAKHGANDEI